MTFTDPANAETVSDFKRDRWGRPLVMQPDGRSRKPYTRASSATKAIDDTWNLDQWDRRNVAYGVAHDTSLAARLLAIGGDPSTWGKGEKDAVAKVVDDARTIAKAHKGADIGTAVHRIIERRNRGEEINAGPYQADVDAYYAALDACGLTILPEFLEVRLVCDELELAGSADNILLRDGRHHIGDLKTGATVEFGVLGFAGQLGAYANSVLYDVVAEKRLPTPDLDDAVGFIIHLPAGQGVCTVYELDLVAGYEAAKVAYRARRAQKAAKAWLTPCKIASAGAAPTAPPDAVPQADVGRSVSPASACPPEQENPCPESAATPPTASRTAATPSATSTTAPTAATSSTSPAPDTSVSPSNSTEPSKADVLAALGYTAEHGHILDEGDPVTPADFAVLEAAFNKIDADGQAWFKRIVKESAQASVPFGAHQTKTVRRYELYRGLIALAASGSGFASDGMARGLAATALDNDAALSLELTVGHVLGVMGASEAAEFARLCVEVVAG